MESFYLYVYVRYIIESRIQFKNRQRIKGGDGKIQHEMEWGNREIYKEKIEELKKEEAMKKLHEVISSLPETELIGVRLVREDRDNNWRFNIG